MADYLEVAQEAARQAGQLLRQMQGEIEAREKAPADLVTEADLASQHLIYQHLTREYPDFGFLGEESLQQPSQPETTADYCWIVDPLDGTTNYVHGLESYGVSIALRDRQQVIAGVVYDPVRDECFTAAVGQGACLNGRPLRTSQVQQLNQALVAASFSARVTPESPEIQRFLQVLYASQAVRRLGSAALNLCYVAAGRLDAYWATSVKIWDVAAGLLLVREAGGWVSAVDGTPFQLERPQFATAATQPLHRQLIQTLAGP